MHKETTGFVPLHEPELEELADFVRENMTDYKVSDDEVRIEVSDDLELLRNEYLTAEELHDLEDCQLVVFYLN